MPAISAYDDWFFSGHHDSDDDTDNPIILEQCIIECEKNLLEMVTYVDEKLFDFTAFKENFARLYEKFIDGYIDENYWKEHSKYYEYVLW